MKNYELKRAFTLIELIAVIAIISVLTVIALPKIMGTLQTSNEVVCAANRTEIEKQINYSLINGTISEDDLKENNGKNVQNITDKIGLDISESCNNADAYTLYFNNGVVNVGYNEQNLSVAVQDSQTVVSTGGFSNTFLIDSNGNKHDIFARYDFETIKSEFKYGGLNLQPGDIISDGIYTFVVLWDSYIQEPEDNNYDLKDLYQANSYNMTEITTATIILTIDDILIKDSGMRWEKEVKAGTVAYYMGDYYICSSDLNVYTLPPNGWIKLSMNQ